MLILHNKLRSVSLREVTVPVDRLKYRATTHLNNMKPTRVVCGVILWLLSFALICSRCGSYKIVRFPGGGIYFWWQAGAASYLTENQKLEDLPLMGASSGSIVASLMAHNVSFYDAANLAIRIGLDNHIWDNKDGLNGVWGGMVREFLQELIPDEASPQSLSRVNVLVTPTLLLRGPVLLSNFQDKSDLINAVMASTHIPIFMDGRAWTTYQGKRYIDGSFWSLVARVKGPYPSKKINRKLDVLHVDYKLDKGFMQNWGRIPITKLIDPADVYAMMSNGYNYMKKLDQSGALCDDEVQVSNTVVENEETKPRMNAVNLHNIEQ